MDRRLYCAVFLMALLAPIMAQAEVIIYDNGAPDLGNAFGSDFDLPQQMADDFVLREGANTITDVHWWGVYAYENTPSEVDDFTIRVFQEAASPDVNPWWESNVGSVARTEVGILGDYYRLFEYSVYIDPLTVAAGQTYYLSIVNDTPNDCDDDWFWARSNIEGDGWWRLNDGDAWMPAYAEMAFHLTGDIIPEPTTVSLVGIGLAIMGLRRITKRS